MRNLSLNFPFITTYFFAHFPSYFPSSAVFPTWLILKMGFPLFFLHSFFWRLSSSFSSVVADPTHFSITNPFFLAVCCFCSLNVLTQFPSYFPPYAVFPASWKGVPPCISLTFPIISPPFTVYTGELIFNPSLPLIFHSLFPSFPIATEFPRELIIKLPLSMISP